MRQYRESYAGAPRRKGLGGRALVGFQIAPSTRLVIGAGLFLRTLAGLKTVDVGFRTDHLLIIEMNPNRIVSAWQVCTAAPTAGCSLRLGAGCRVGDASANNLHIGQPHAKRFHPGRYERAKNQAEYYKVVGNNFFATLGIPIVGYPLCNPACGAAAAILPALSCSSER
jgi:hypothetical protein